MSDIEPNLNCNSSATGRRLWRMSGFCTPGLGCRPGPIAQVPDFRKLAGAAPLLARLGAWRGLEGPPRVDPAPAHSSHPWRRPYRPPLPL